MVADEILRKSDDGVAISVWVVPGSSRSVIDGRHGDMLKVRVAAPAEGGRANREAERLLSDRLGAEVTLKSGMRGRSKVFLVFQVDLGTIRRKLDL